VKIAIIGAGYVGLVSGACFAQLGHDVVCIDNDKDKIASLERGTIPIFENGLADLVHANAAADRLSFSTEIARPVANADVVFLCVGTPSRNSDGHADLTYVYGATRQIAKDLNDYTVIVTKSTVPVGTGDEIARIIKEVNPRAQFSLISNPEFLREGAAISDFLNPDRIVVGCNDDRGRKVMEKLYYSFAKENVPILYVSRRTSELIKYSANAFLSVKLTFINEIADLCEAVGANVQDVADGIGYDKRIGRSFLNAGPGYGGSCFPKDTMALVRTAHDFKSPVRTVETIVAINEFRKRAMAQKIAFACGGSLRNKTIGILGLTFKPDTDDMRESPAISIIEALQDFGANVQAYDPQGMKEAKHVFANVNFANSAYEAANNADALAIITEWSEFAELDFDHLAKKMKHCVLVDLRNMFDEETISKFGFDYYSIGRESADI